MSNTTYDNLKKVAQLGLPAAGVLYSALAGIWGWPYGVEIVGSLAAIDTFLGVALEIASANYTAS